MINKLILWLFKKSGNKCKNCHYYTGSCCWLHESSNSGGWIYNPIMDKDDGCNSFERNQDD